VTTTDARTTAHIGDGSAAPQYTVLICQHEREDDGYVSQVDLAEWTVDYPLTPENLDKALAAGGWQRTADIEYFRGGIFTADVRRA